MLTVAFALGIGMYGYHVFAALPWIDAFVNASMILSGMGPMAELKTDAAKLFAGTYALFSGLIFIGIAGILVAPVLHRLMHKFHLESGGEAEGSNEKPKKTH